MSAEPEGRKPIPVKADVIEPVADERPARYVETFTTDDGLEMERVVYRASSLGGCTRAVVAAARKFSPKPHPQWFEEVLDEGRRMEARISDMHAAVTKVANRPWPNGEQWEVELEVGMIDGRMVVIRGHMDDISEDTGGEQWTRVREYKKFRPSTWQDFLKRGVKVNDHYPWQVAVYMHATGLECEFVGGQYIPATEVDYETVPEHIKGTFCHLYREPPITLLEIKRKVAKVERLVNEGWAPDEVECSGGYPCAYWYLHDPKPEPVELPGDDEELNGIVAEYMHAHSEQKTAEKMAEQAAERKKAIAEKLNAYIESAGHPGTGGTYLLNGLRMTRTRSHIPEATMTRTAYTKDYWTMKAKKGAEQ